MAKTELNSDDIERLFDVYLNGCTFKAVMTPKKIGITYGCNCLYNLLTGIDRYIADLISMQDNNILWFNPKKEISLYSNIKARKQINKKICKICNKQKGENNVENTAADC